jgi:hypothetical protein
VTRWDATKARLQIAQDLTAIEDTYARLRAEAYHHAGDSDIPGGTATVMLGPRADVEAWLHIQESAARGRLNPGNKWSSRHQVAIELDEIQTQGSEPPLSFLAGWVDIIRAERAQGPGPTHATITTEAGYLRDALDWITATDHETGAPWWSPAQTFIDQLHDVRYALEEVLKEGERDDTGAPCLNETCKGVRLVKKWAGTIDKPRPAAFDIWQCPRCSRRYKADEYRIATRQASRIYADRLTASDMLETYRVQPATLRKWVERGKVRRRGKDQSGRILYDVSDTLKQRDRDDTEPDVSHLARTVMP